MKRSLRDFQHFTVDVNGAAIHSVTAGTGPPIVFVAGWPEWWYSWRQVMAALEDRYTVHAVDLRGQGLSHKPLSGYDTGAVAAELHEWTIVREIEDFVLVGHDVGSWVAFSYAASYAELRGVALLDALIPGLAVPNSKPGRPSDKANIGQWQFSFNRLPDLPETLVRGHEREFMTWMFKYKSLSPNSIGPDVLDAYVEALKDRDFLRAGFEYYRALPTTDRQNQELAKKRLAMPLLTIGAVAGVGHMLFEQLAPLCDRIEDATMKDCGHFQMEENPEGVVAALEPFLQQCFAEPTASVSHSASAGEKSAFAWKAGELGATRTTRVL